LKHFISGTNDTVLREIIADKLNDPAFDEPGALPQPPALFWDEIVRESIGNNQPPNKGLGKLRSISLVFNRPVLAKIVAIATMALLMLTVYSYI